MGGCLKKTSAKVEESSPIDSSEFITEEKLRDLYDIKDKLGEGKVAVVSKCTKKSTGVDYAVKSYKEKADGAPKEIEIMKMMDHPNIVKLHQVFQEKWKIHLLMEICNGGELLPEVQEVEGCFTEVQAKNIMQQILQGLSYMHAMWLIHRDLKPQNFLFLNKGPMEKCILKIIDFDYADKCPEGTVLTLKCGTPNYVAPQVLAGKYDLSADLWSCGVNMYLLLCGYPPFYADSDGAVLSKVRLGNFIFQDSDWSNVSQDAMDLIRKLLDMNPRTRFTAEQALNHIWITTAEQALNQNIWIKPPAGAEPEASVLPGQLPVDSTSPAQPSRQGGSPQGRQSLEQQILELRAQISEQQEETNKKIAELASAVQRIENKLLD